ncbi:MAG: hypothetical protein WCX73_04335 [Candidatus Pacearchaeota archaeon]|jgi:hypothetical protein
MKREQNLENSTEQALTIPVVSGSFPIKDSYTKEEVKKIALAFTRAATPSKYIEGIENRFEQVWQLNFGS